jgi:hypothetical protein
MECLYEIYQCGFELSIEPKTYYHNCSIFSGSLTECKNRLDFINSLPYKIGDNVNGDLIKSINILGPISNNEYIVTYYGYKSGSFILGSEYLLNKVIYIK